jgi:glycosyltransferase involved in cell wall biosynthesis
MSDLQVISSRHEAGPVTLREAAVVGVPTVGTAVGEIADWAPHAALAVPVGESEMLAGQVAALLTDEELRLRVAREAYTRATCEDAGYTARLFEDLYEELLRARSRRRATRTR